MMRESSKLRARFVTSIKDRDGCNDGGSIGGQGEADDRPFFYRFCAGEGRVVVVDQPNRY